MLKKINSKGFTLIELLAVIVILGILMIVAIPAVTKYIANSKKDTFADNAGAYINSARYMLLNGELYTATTDASGKEVADVLCPTPSVAGTHVYVNISNIDLDKGAEKSSFGYAYNSNSFVDITFDGTKLEYSIWIVDNKNNGTDDVTKENELGRIKIVPNASSKIPSGTKCIPQKG